MSVNNNISIGEKGTKCNNFVKQYFECQVNELTYFVACYVEIIFRTIIQKAFDRTLFFVSELSKASVIIVM